MKPGHIILFKAAVVIVWLAGSSSLHAQDPDEKRRQQLIEKFIENQEGGADYTDLMDQFDTYLRQPLNLNTCTREQLMQIPLLPEMAATQLLEHRKKYGPLLSVYELMAVQSLDAAAVQLLMAYGTVETAQARLTLSALKKDGRHQVLWQAYRQAEEVEGQRRRRLADTAGRSYYAGSPLRTVFRYAFTYKNRLSVALTGEKDAGETFGRGINRQGFDFNSFHVCLSESGWLKRLVVGDFNAVFGQGLAFGSGLAFGKSANVMAVKKNVQGLRPYRSVNENEFLRGVGAAFRLGRVEVTLFGSHKRIDGNLGTDTLLPLDERGFTTLVSSGLHRTAGEIANKHTVQQSIAGIHANLSLSRLQVGFTGVAAATNPARIAGHEPYKLYSPSGPVQHTAGIDYKLNYRNLSLFGEVAAGGRGAATLNGLIVSLGQRIDAVIAHRYYSPGFQPIYSNAWGETSQNTNEKGLYTSLSVRLPRGFFLTMYADRFEFPWLRYKVDQPGTGGFDAFGELTWLRGKKFSMNLRYRHENKLQNRLATEAILSNLGQQTRETLRFQAAMQPGRKLGFKTRMELSRYQAEGRNGETGLLMFQDAEFTAIPQRLWATVRVALFSTGGFYSRMYAYENDLMYTYSVPAYQHEGIRCFVMLHAKLSRGVSMAAKCVYTEYQNRQTLGSGLEEIGSNHSTDVRLQLHINL